LVFFPDISKSVFIAVALFICSLSTLSCFTDIFGTSVPIDIPPPIFSYLFLSLPIIPLVSLLNSLI
ncbi:hypothetical protein, partial [Fusobacterium hwasookii]